MDLYMRKNQITTTSQHETLMIPRKKFDSYFTQDQYHYLVEFDGDQHFEFNNYFHKSEDVFISRQVIDRIKTYVPLALGYRLIRIDHTQVDNIEKHLDKALSAIQSGKIYYCSSPDLYQYLLEPITREQMMLHAPGFVQTYPAETYTLSSLPIN